MFVTMVVAALIVDGAFDLAGLIPADRPSADEVMGTIQLDYKAALNALGVAIFATLIWLTVRHGATDPVCGMRVDRGKALTAQHGGRTHFFCSEGCRDNFQGDPDRYTGALAAASEVHVASRAG